MFFALDIFTISYGDRNINLLPYKQTELQMINHSNRKKKKKKCYELNFNLITDCDMAIS